MLCYAFTWLASLMVVEICEFSSYNCTICYHKTQGWWVLHCNAIRKTQSYCISPSVSYFYETKFDIWADFGQAAVLKISAIFLKYPKGQLISKCLLGIFKMKKKSIYISTMVTEVELFLFVFWKNWRQQKDISKLTEIKVRKP